MFVVSYVGFISMKKIVIVYNTSHYVYLFRLSLITELINSGYSVTVVAPYDEYSERLIEFGVEYVDFEMNNESTSIISELISICKLWKILSTLSPDIVLNYTVKPNIYSSIICRFLSIPTINNVTGLGTAFIQGGWLTFCVKLLYRVTHKNVGHVFFQNKYDLELFLSSKLLTKGKLSLLPGSGVDTNRYRPVPNSKNGNKFIFLLVARLIKDKGILEYVEAARLFKAKYPDEEVEFCLLGAVGVANRTAISFDDLNQWQKKGYITYLGTTDDVRKDISKSDCIVLPSYREGTSKILLEASSMGKPIVTTDVPGCNNVVDNGTTGYLCKVKNAFDLFVSIEKMHQLSEDDRLEFGNNARMKMIEHFDEKIVIENYLSQISLLTKEDL